MPIEYASIGSISIEWCPNLATSIPISMSTKIYEAPVPCLTWTLDIYLYPHFRLDTNFD